MPVREWSDPVAVTIVNPNSTQSMTRSMLAAARACVPSRSFAGVTSHAGPPAIQGAADGDAASGPMLEVIGDVTRTGAEAIIIGCFDDTALSEAAAQAPCPVVGIGQAAFHECALRQWRFSVVTTLSVSVPVITANIERYGLTGWLGKVRASEVPVLALEADPRAATRDVLAEAQRAVAEDEIDAVVLGCAGMVQMTEEVRRNLRLPVIDPVESAARSVNWLVPE